MKPPQLTYSFSAYIGGVGWCSYLCVFFFFFFLGGGGGGGGGAVHTYNSDINISLIAYCTDENFTRH